MSDRELPGFYRDPKTGKYYRDKPEHSNDFLKKLKQKEMVNMDKRELVRHAGQGHTLPHFFRRRELGFLSGSQVSRNYYKSRTSARALQCTTDFRTDENLLSGIEYIKGGARSVFGLWNTTNPVHPYALGEAPQKDMQPVLYTQFQKCTAFIQDMCEIFTDTIVYVQNNYEDSGTINLIWQDYYSPSGYGMYSHFHINREPLYCCAATFLGFIRLAVGGLDSICYYHELSPVREYKVDGRAMTICFDDSKNYIISGHSTGFVYMHDLRSEFPVFNKQIEMGEEKCLVDSLFLPPDKIIYTGVNNKLVMFDMRSMKPLIEYQGHKHSVQKNAISIANDMLCVTGADNVIRIWHTSGGLPVQEIFPTVAGTKIKGWVGTDCDKTYLYYFEGTVRKIFEL